MIYKGGNMKKINQSFIGEVLINLFLVIYAFGFLLFKEKTYRLSSIVFSIFLISIAILSFVKFLKKEENKYNYIDLVIFIVLFLLGISLIISLSSLIFNITVVLIIYIFISLINKFRILEKLKKNSKYFYLNLYNTFIMFLSVLFLLLDLSSNIKIFIMLIVYVLANSNFIFISKIEVNDSEFN